MTSLSELKQSKPEEFAVIQQKSEDYWNNVSSQQDRDQIKKNLALLPITVIGNKYDLFAKSIEPKMKKIFCLALRYICHANGADLVFTSINVAQPLKLLRNIMNYHSFRNLVS
jgi:hypothetical protein